MWLLATLAAVALIGWVLVDSFETVVVPRRVMHRFRFARLFYYAAWSTWRRLALCLKSGKRREALLSWFGPLSLLGLFASWVLGLIFSYALLQWSLGLEIHTPDGSASFFNYFYLSGVTFFTLGYGDVVPVTTLGRVLAVCEAGMGIGFLAAIISYLPVLFQAFSRREATIALLDARAGSPPSAGQFLLRLARSGSMATADPFLAEWERWSAELLESHLSFPTLSFYRSQHDNQSWLSALTCILDSCSFLIIGTKGSEAYQAQLTFAMARHTAVDLALVLKVPPVSPDDCRLPREQVAALREQLHEAGFHLHDEADLDEKLTELRAMYEPFVEALSRRLLFALPPILPHDASVDNWQRSASQPRPPGIGNLPGAEEGEGHF
ncbi:MAG: potassium channel family protein [Planctomycetia bacterium]|nr:potassium channel family protein [Planctomycetia bacterium]